MIKNEIFNYIEKYEYTTLNLLDIDVMRGGDNIEELLMDTKVSALYDGLDFFNHSYIMVYDYIMPMGSISTGIYNVCKDGITNINNDRFISKDKILSDGISILIRNEDNIV